jgi:hypothetical protein
MKRRISIILFLIIGFVYSQEQYFHPQTNISFYATSSVHTIYIDNVYIDNFNATIAEYDTETAPTGSVDDLLNPNNPIEADAIFIYYSPNAGTEVCVGWTYFHKNSEDKTVLRVYGNDLFINNPPIVNSYPSNNASGELFSFKIFDANANELGDVDVLPGVISYPLSPFSHGSNQTVISLSGENIFGCENPTAFNMDENATAPCDLTFSDNCQECGYGITNFHQITGFVGNDVNENIDCGLNTEEGNDVTIHWNTPNTLDPAALEPEFEFRYIIIDAEFAGADTVIGETSYVITDRYGWGTDITIAVYAWNGYIGPNQELSYSGEYEYASNDVTISLCPEPLPEAPQNFTAIAGEGTVDLSWDEPNNGHTESYNLYVNGGGVPINIASTEHSESNLESNREYFYVLKAVNTWGVEGDSTDTIYATTLPMKKVQDYNLKVGLQSIELNWDLPEPYGGNSSYNYIVYRWNGFDDSVCDPEFPPCDGIGAGYCSGSDGIENQLDCELSGREWIFNNQCVFYNYYFENDGYGNENIEIMWDDTNGDGFYQEDEQLTGEPNYNCRGNYIEEEGISQTRLIIDENLNDTEYYCFSIVAKHSQGESEHSRLICGKPQPLFNWQINIDVELEVSNTYSIYDTSNILGSSGGNGSWDPNETYIDENYNGQYDIGEEFIDNGATDGYDPRFDLPEPITPPNEWVQLYFPHENEGMWENQFNLDKFTQDIRELEYYQSNPRTWIGHIVTDQPGELKISFDIKTEVDSITNVDEDTLKFFTFIRGDFVDEPVLVLDQLVIDGHSGVHMSNGDCPLTLSMTENELCNETIDELFVDSMDTVLFAITVGYKPPQPRQGLTVIGDYRQITVYWDEPDECCGTDDGIFPPENYDVFRNMSIFEEDTTDSMIKDGLEQEYYVDIGYDLDVTDDWFTVPYELLLYGDDPNRLLDETEYFYNVRGNNVAGSGPYTAQVSAFTGENRKPISIISLSSGDGSEDGIIAENIDSVFIQIPHNGLGDLNPVSIFLDGSLSKDLDEPVPDSIRFDWNLLDNNQHIDFENTESDFIEIVVRNQFDTDTNYYHLELIVTDTYFRGIWDGDELNIIPDHNEVKDTVVIVVAPEINHAPIAEIMKEYGDYNENGVVENSLYNNEQLFDITPEEIYPYLNMDPTVLAEFYPYFWIPPHDGDPETDWAAIGFRGFGERFFESSGILENGYMDLDNFGEEMEEWIDLDNNGRWTYASYDPDDYPLTHPSYWGLENAPQGGLHDTLYFDWEIGQNPEILTFDTPPLNVYNDGDNFVDANGNGFWDAGDPFTLQNLTIYRQPGTYDISLVIRDDYNYRDTTSFQIHVLPEFNQLPNVRLGNFYNDRLSYHLPEGEQTYHIEFPLDTSGCVSWYLDQGNPIIYAECGYPFGTIVSEPFIDENGDNVYNEGENYTELYPNGLWDGSLISVYDSNNDVEDNGFYDTLLIHQISDQDFWLGNDGAQVFDDLQYQWFVDGVLRGDDENFGYDLGIGTHEIVVEVIDPYGNFDSLKTTDTVTVYVAMEPIPAPVIASDANLTEDLYYVELTWLESEFNNDNDMLGIEADNWPYGFPQIAENEHLASEYKILRKRPNGTTPDQFNYTEVALLNVEIEDQVFFSQVIAENGRKKFYYYDNGLLPGEEYCYKIRPANSHGSINGSMICGENCGFDDADSDAELCVETVQQFNINLSNFTEPHIINSYEYDSIGYKIDNGELQYIETDQGDVEILDLQICNQYKGLWNTETQSCELDPRPFLDRIEIAYQSLQMNGDTNWVNLTSFLYEFLSAQDSFYTWLDIDSDSTINYIVDKHMVNGHIGYILNDPNEYVQLYAKDGNYLNDFLYNDYLPETAGNFGKSVINDDVTFRFRLYDHGDFNGHNCIYLLDEESCLENYSCKWDENENYCDNYFHEEFTTSPLIITSDTLIYPFWTENYDPFESNSGAAGAKFMLGLPFSVTEENILLNSLFSEYFIDWESLEGEFNEEWLISDDLGTSGNPLITGEANILWLKDRNLIQFNGQTLKTKSIELKEGWNLLTNPLVAKIHKTSLKFIMPSDINNCGYNSTYEECKTNAGCVWDLISESSELSECKSVISWGEADSIGIVSSSLNTWNSKENRYDDVEILEPFNGYWIHVGDLNYDGEITPNGVDNNMRYSIYYEPSVIPSQEEIDAQNQLDWRFKLRMKPRRIDGALSNQYGGDYIEIGLGESDVVNNGFSYGEDEHNLKAFPTLTYPGDLFIQRVDWQDSLLVPDNLRYYKDFRTIEYNWDEINSDSECTSLDSLSCDSFQDCLWNVDEGDCGMSQEGAYVWNLTSIIGNASNVSDNTTQDWIVKFEWNLQEAIYALTETPNIPIDNPDTEDVDESAIFELHYVKMRPNEIEEDYEVDGIESIPLNVYPVDECEESEAGNVCIEIPFNNMLKLENMSLDDTYTWNVRLVLGKKIPLSYFGEQEESISDLNLPKQFEFGNAYPNPFNPSTTFDFALPRMAEVNVEVYNVLGQKVMTLLGRELLNAGYHSISFDGSHLASGIYLVNAQLGENYRKVNKVILFK